MSRTVPVMDADAASAAGAAGVCVQGHGIEGSVDSEITRTKAMLMSRS
jgi:hypothetical protein